MAVARRAPAAKRDVPASLHESDDFVDGLRHWAVARDVCNEVHSIACNDLSPFDWVRVSGKDVAVAQPGVRSVAVDHHFVGSRVTAPGSRRLETTLIVP